MFLLNNEEQCITKQTIFFPYHRVFQGPQVIQENQGFLDLRGLLGKKEILACQENPENQAVEACQGRRGHLALKDPQDYQYVLPNVDTF